MYSWSPRGVHSQILCLYMRSYIRLLFHVTVAFHKAITLPFAESWFGITVTSPCWPGDDDFHDGTIWKCFKYKQEFEWGSPTRNEGGERLLKCTVKIASHLSLQISVIRMFLTENIVNPVCKCKSHLSIGTCSSWVSLQKGNGAIRGPRLLVKLAHTWTALQMGFFLGRAQFSPLIDKTKC